MKIYLASPFFNPAQVAVVEAIEKVFEEKGIDFYSPRKEGVLINMTPDERRASTQRIFDKNVEEILRADKILAVVDGRDPGTTWEVGFGYAKRIPIITYTDQGFGLNVMIQKCVSAHVKGIDMLKEYLDFIESPNVSSRLYSKFLDFSEDVT
jgi:nucleoside 2-deoxyribosyltransferase